MSAKKKIRSHHQRNYLVRGEPSREPIPRILIVCEGEKTEPIYFEAIRKEKRLSSNDIEIVGRGAVPKTIVEEAKKKSDAAKREAKYDQVWCVFDRNEHPNIDAALQMAKKKWLSSCIFQPFF